MVGRLQGEEFIQMQHVLSVLKATRVAQWDKKADEMLAHLFLKQKSRRMF